MYVQEVVYGYIERADGCINLQTCLFKILDHRFKFNQIIWIERKPFSNGTFVTTPPYP